MHPWHPAAAHLLESAKRNLAAPRAGVAPWPRGHRAVNFFQQGLEAHAPQPGRYDVIWLQWAALYLTDGGRLWGGGGVDGGREGGDSRLYFGPRPCCVGVGVGVGVRGSTPVRL
jgi:hypothetical protein